METIERTHVFPRNQRIPCDDWLHFAIVESTIKGFRICYVREVEFDNDGQSEVELDCTDNP